jgi:hypothetical protein
MANAVGPKPAALLQNPAHALGATFTPTQQ